MKHWQRNLSILSVLILLVFFIWGWIYCHNPDHFPIRVVEINPANSINSINSNAKNNTQSPAPNILHFVSQASIQNIVSPYVSQGFFNIPVSKIREALLAQPGIAEVSVTRRFPDLVRINITEDQPVALYDHDSFIDPKGLIITPEMIFGLDSLNLPVFIGPSDQMVLMVNQYESFLEVLNNFKNLNFKMTQLSLDDYGQWEIILNTGLVIDCGNQDVLNRLNDFLKAYPDLIPPDSPGATGLGDSSLSGALGAVKSKSSKNSQSKNSQSKNQNNNQSLVSADLRYSEGFALRWN